MRTRKRAEALFLHDEAVFEINERLAEVKKSFTLPALIGAFPEIYQPILPNAVSRPDEETLKLDPASHDLIVHTFGLHWANDPVGQIVQSRLALKPDGLFLGVLFGGQTLHELRASLAEAEIELLGGLSPRVAPMADLRDLGALLQRAGLSLPVADTRTLNVTYGSLTALMHELRFMGEANALIARKQTFTPRGLFNRAEQIYRENFADENGRLKATFELVFLTGWAPSDTQQKPLRPGSAKTRLADALGVPEQPGGDKASPDQI